MSTFVGAAAALLLLGAHAGARAEAPADTPQRPSLVYVLMDTTRADHIGAWGWREARTPVLDGLAAAGIRFARHFANAHATRSSMPQLMSGRYYHQSILRQFEPDRTPREFSFLRPDPTATLAPSILVAAGYQALGASAHPWVVADSAFGQPFERLELVASAPSRGHADAAPTVDSALAAWRARDRARPTFLYVHLMDAHMPRFVPADAAPPRIPGYDPATRFGANGEPAFDPRRRRWDRMDASDFTADDRRWFSAVYDANLAHLDRQLGRLLDGVRADDPALAHTLLVVTADHGEELGEDGRSDHGDSLADAVQHVPWIVAGAGIPAGQVMERFSEHVDVLPTLLGRLGVPLPDGIRIDGIDWLGPDGRPRPGLAKRAVFYAWDDYRGMRSRRYLLRENRPDSLRARCDGRTQLYAFERDRRVPSADAARAVRLEAGLRRHLDGPQRAFAALSANPPTRSFTWGPTFWALDPGTQVACVPVGPDTTRGALRAPGWLWTGRGTTVLQEEDHDRPLVVRVAAPDGDYRVEAAAVPVDPMPWLLHFARWARRSFVPRTPTEWVPLGSRHAEHGSLLVSLAEAVGRGHHLLGLRLTPASAGAESADGARGTDDPGLRRRLEALGYVQ